MLIISKQQAYPSLAEALAGCLLNYMLDIENAIHNFGSYCASDEMAIQAPGYYIEDSITNFVTSDYHQTDDFQYAGLVKSK